MEKATFENKNYYDLLGIERNASLDDIKRAYKQLARKHHPDALAAHATEIDELDNLDLSKTRAFKILTFAYNTLKDPQLREQYDRTLPPIPNTWSEPLKDEVGEKLKQFSKHSPRDGFAFGQMPPQFDDDDVAEAAMESDTPDPVRPVLETKKGFFKRLFSFLA